MKESSFEKRISVPAGALPRTAFRTDRAFMI
jgi:hypothetical protein